MAKLKTCEIPDCNKPTGPRSALCSACLSWWYRMCMKSPEELVQYLHRMNRYSSRVVFWRQHGRRRKAA